MLLKSRQRRGRRARNQQLWIGIIKWCIVIGAVAGCSLYAYQSGLGVGVHERDDLNQKYADARQQIAKLTDRARAMTDSAAKARAPLQALSSHMTPEQAADLMTLIRNKLDAGLKPDRLTAIIETAQNDRQCLGTQYRRLVVATPAVGPVGTSASFRAEQAQITAKGENAIDDNGAPEAWYDTAKPVSLNITIADSPGVTVEGTLPLSKTIQTNGRQLRFEFSAGKQGLLSISLDDCAYP